MIEIPDGWRLLDSTELIQRGDQVECHCGNRYWWAEIPSCWAGVCEAGHDRIVREITFAEQHGGISAREAEDIRNEKLFGEEELRRRREGGAR